jgi:hypothetical protein
MNVIEFLRFIWIVRGGKGVGRVPPKSRYGEVDVLSRRPFESHIFDGQGCNILRYRHNLCLEPNSICTSTSTSEIEIPDRQPN